MFFIAQKYGEFGFVIYVFGALDDKLEILIWYRVFGIKAMLRKAGFCWTLDRLVGATPTASFGNY